MEAIKIEMVDDVKSKYYSAASATRAVCEVFDIEREELLGKKRTASCPIVLPFQCQTLRTLRVLHWRLSNILILHHQPFQF